MAKPEAFFQFDAATLGTSHAGPSPDDGIAYDGERLRSFNEGLLAARSATAFLRSCCIANGLGEAPIVAVKDGLCDPPDDFILDVLRPRQHEATRRRRVKLVCGSIVLAHADNWYLPNRLAKPDCDALEDTDIPFGTLVAPLKPRRRTLRIEFLAELDAIKNGRASDVHASTPVLEHTAVLVGQDGLALCAVRENFLGIVLK